MAEYTSEHTGVEIDLAVGNANLVLLTGAADPATSTIGTLGQIYQNTTDGTLFRCTNIAGENYTWTEWADYSLAEKTKVTNAITNVGDLTYTEDNYVTDEESLTESVDALDVELKDANDRAGTLASLTTTEKGSLVGAVNEVDSHADTNTTNIGDLAYTEANYITDSEPLTESVDKLDMAVKDNADLISTNKEEFDTHLIKFASLFPNNAGAHNSIFRGKYLGSSVTAEQYLAISSGTFEDLYIGDYWTINGVNWRIAAFNYYRNTGDSLVPGNHLVIVSDESLYSHVMNDTNTTDGGYIGSKMYIEGLEQAKTIINNAFSGHVVTFRAYLCNAVSNGEASAGGWVDSAVDLMNEIMVYGSVVNGAATYGLYNIGTEKSQLPLFVLNPQSINTRYSYWLRDVASASAFAGVYAGGNASLPNAGSSGAVRPRFLIS